jgi:hypothetical protein
MVNDLKLISSIFFNGSNSFEDSKNHVCLFLLNYHL